jgi:hypothetical protein
MHYKVYYPEDGDDESLSEYELDALDIVDDRQGGSGNEEEVDQSSDDDDDDDDDDMSSIEPVQPKFPIGTRFMKVSICASTVLLVVLVYTNGFFCGNSMHCVRRSFPGTVDLRAVSLTLTANVMKSIILKTMRR